MKKWILYLLLLCSLATQSGAQGTASVLYNTKTHAVQKPATAPAAPFDLDFAGLLLNGVLTKNAITLLPEDTGPASNDYFMMYDASGDQLVKVSGGNYASSLVITSITDPTTGFGITFNTSNLLGNYVFTLPNGNQTSILPAIAPTGQFVNGVTSTGQLLFGIPSGGGGGGTLAGLSDVTISSPTTNQVLVYDSSLSKWKNATDPGGGGGGTPPGGSPGQGQFNNAGSFGGIAGMNYSTTGPLLQLTTGTLAAPTLEFTDPVDNTKRFWVNASNIPTATVEQWVIPSFSQFTNSPYPLNAGTLLGRSGPGSGIPQIINIGTGFTLVGGTLNSSAPPGGSNLQMQFNNAGAMGGVSTLTTNGTTVNQTAGSNYFLLDPTDNTKKVGFNLASLPTATTENVVVANSANPVIPGAGTAGAGNCVTGISTLGVLQFGACSGGGGGTPGGSNGQVQYNNATAFGGISSLTTNGTVVTQSAGSNYRLADPTDSTKQVGFSLAGLPTATVETVTVPNSANPVIVAAANGTGGQFVSGIGTNGVINFGTPAGGGNVSNSGTPTSGQVGIWQSATTLAGVTPTSPVQSTSSTLSLNMGVDFQFQATQSITANTILTSAPINALQLGATSSGTVANGFGVALNASAQDSAGNNSIGKLAWTWTNITHGSSASLLDFQLASAGSLPASKAQLFSDGGFSVNNTTDPGAGIISANTGYWVGTAASTSGKILKSDGSAFKPSTETYAAPGANGNVMTSDGTNWTSAAPTGGGVYTLATPLTGDTTINSTTTQTTGGVTLSATAASGSTWKIRAYGDYVATSSATARNFVVTPFWGSTALPTVSQVVKVSTALTSSWTCDFLFRATSTTAVWTTGNLATPMQGSVQALIATATSGTTTVTSGAQTLDLRFSNNNVVAGDSVVVKQVIMERVQ